MFKKIPNLYNENIKARAIAVQILADKEAALKASIESLSKTKNFKVIKSSKKRKLDTKQNIEMQHRIALCWTKKVLCFYIPVWFSLV